MFKRTTLLFAFFSPHFYKDESILALNGSEAELTSGKLTVIDTSPAGYYGTDNDVDNDNDDDSDGEEEEDEKPSSS
ncbi:unnamed protein product [Gongylonema pulchrum]|uniref:Secreted protein n=1 Tax=Gongylonema pulchrum TaxID=637853 RepID=A0A183CU62_9BILA|nr:unnamed protein product [Gongylonema pulchrum]